MNKNIILYVLLGIILLAVILMTFFPNIIYVIKDSGKTGVDKCNPPEGQTLEQWNEHMSHHPSMYKECLT
ncbi:MAG: hypothetical protein NUV97_02105 [archaeon]|nr:hypothetical protein [archaeon]MCR4323744.1 hypothetical protein [Nanoarchaeota archaeon]